MEAVVDEVVRQIIWHLGLLARQYSDAKRYISEAMGASQDLLHVHAGLLIFVVSALLLRRKMRSPLPLLIVILFALINESADWMAGKDVWRSEPIADVINTIIWPAILFAAARRWR